MDRKKDRELEAWAENIMGEARLESPPMDCTQKLMQRLDLGHQKEVYRYRRLVAKGTFALMFTGFAALWGYFFLSGEASHESNWFPPLDLGPFFQQLLGWSDRWAPSMITLFAVSIFGRMFLIQFGFMKKRTDNRRGTSSH